MVGTAAIQSGRGPIEGKKLRMTSVDHTICDLAERPDLLPIVADRIWRAWWRDEGLSLAEMEAMVAESLGAAPMPFTLVAHRAGLFLGTASVIADDLKARPAYTPWLAAVFVEPYARRAGIAASLVESATRKAFLQPIERLYLNATPANSSLYEKLGWALVEADVGGLNVYSTTRPVPDCAGEPTDEA